MLLYKHLFLNSHLLNHNFLIIQLALLFDPFILSIYQIDLPQHVGEVVDSFITLGTACYLWITVIVQEDHSCFLFLLLCFINLLILAKLRTIHHMRVHYHHIIPCVGLILIDKVGIIGNHIVVVNLEVSSF